MNLLVTAYACEPNCGSEKGVGWNYSYLLSKHVNVTLITRIKNKPAIEDYLKKNGKFNLTVYYYDLPKYLRLWKRKTFGLYLYYYLWQIGIYFKIKKNNFYKQFDIFHYLTFGTFWLPTFIPYLPIKFVWGPIGGAEKPPKFYILSLPFQERIYERLRILNIRFAKINPLLKSNIKYAVCILTKSGETKKFFIDSNPNTIVFGESAVELKLLEAENFKKDHPFTFISVGRLIPLKGYQYALKAFKIFLQKHVNAEYRILGNGSFGQSLEKLCCDEGIKDKVNFGGVVSREEVFKALTNSEVFLHPSLHDSGGWACIEAMSCGCPVIALKIGGPAIQVTNKCGFLVEPLSESQVVNEIAQKMIYLYENPDVAYRMKKECIEHVKRNFNWEKKINDMLRIYKQVQGAKN